MSTHPDDARINAYNADKHLTHLNQELDRLQTMLFEYVQITDEATGETCLQARPLFANAQTLIDKVKAQINSYTKEHYPDLFPGK